MDSIYELCAGCVEAQELNRLVFCVEHMDQEGVVFTGMICHISQSVVII
jgi:hypothetical protein